MKDLPIHLYAYSLYILDRLDIKDTLYKNYIKGLIEGNELVLLDRNEFLEFIKVFISSFNKKYKNYLKLSSPKISNDGFLEFLLKGEDNGNYIFLLSSLLVNSQDIAFFLFNLNNFIDENDLAKYDTFMNSRTKALNISYMFNDFLDSRTMKVAPTRTFAKILVSDGNITASHSSPLNRIYHKFSFNVTYRTNKVNMITQLFKLVTFAEVFKYFYDLTKDMTVKAGNSSAKLHNLLFCRKKKLDCVFDDFISDNITVRYV